MKLARTLDQWRNLDPEAMATQQSDVARMFAFRDARHDILALAELNAELVQALTECLQNTGGGWISASVIDRARAALAKAGAS